MSSNTTMPLTQSTPSPTKTKQVSFSDELKNLKSSTSTTPSVPSTTRTSSTPNNPSSKAAELPKGPVANAMEQDLSFEMDRNFLSWMQKQNVSFLLTSYKSNNVYAIGMENDPKTGEAKVAIYMAMYRRPMGLYIYENNDIYMSTLNSVWKFVNLGETDDTESGIPNAKFDRLYMPRVSWITNDVDAHDIVVDQTKQVHFITPLYSCIAKPSQEYSFETMWKPEWISKIAREDRCHLNGMCLRDGRIKYATAVSQTDIRHGWREKNRVGSGVIVDVETNEVVCDGLTMPHSPRWHNGKLFVLNAGCGEFGYVDFTTKKFVNKTFISGFLRGLDFVGDRYAVIGSSLDRHEKTFSNLPLGQKLEKNKVNAICGIHVVDLKTFDVLHEISFTGQIVEIYDIGVLKGVRRPKLLGFYDDMVNLEHHVKE